MKAIFRTSEAESILNHEKLLLSVLRFSRQLRMKPQSSALRSRVVM